MRASPGWYLVGVVVDLLVVRGACVGGDVGVPVRSWV